jgi:hypothetical protein
MGSHVKAKNQHFFKPACPPPPHHHHGYSVEWLQFIGEDISARQFNTSLFLQGHITLVSKELYIYDKMTMWVSLRMLYLLDLCLVLGIYRGFGWFFKMETLQFPNYLNWNCNSNDVYIPHLTLLNYKKILTTYSIKYLPSRFDMSNHGVTSSTTIRQKNTNNPSSYVY